MLVCSRLKSGRLIGKNNSAEALSIAGLARRRAFGAGARAHSAVLAEHRHVWPFRYVMREFPPSVEMTVLRWKARDSCVLPRVFIRIGWNVPEPITRVRSRTQSINMILRTSVILVALISQNTRIGGLSYPRFSGFLALITRALARVHVQRVREPVI